MNQQDWSTLKTRFQNLQPSWPTLAIIAFDLTGLIVSAILHFSGGWVSRILAIPLLTLVLLHAYLIVHEATHSALSRNRALNDLAGHLCGWLILMPYRVRQRSHLLHHMWTGHPKGDPANERVIRGFSVMTQGQAKKLERIWKSWLPMLTINDRIGLWKDPFRQRASGSRSQRFEREIRTARNYLYGYVLALAAFLATGSLSYLVGCFLPALLLLLALEELANLPHHAETPLLEEEDKALPYWEQHKVTHSCRSVPVWSNLVLLNFNQHVAHHLFPWIPWHELPRVHREISRLLPSLEDGHTTETELAWSLRNRRRPLLKIMGHYFDRIPHSRTNPREEELPYVNPAALEPNFRSEARV